MQAYGWGLYFADARSVAEWYRDNLAKETIFFNGKPVSPSLQHVAIGYFVHNRLIAFDRYLEEYIAHKKHDLKQMRSYEEALRDFYERGYDEEDIPGSMQNKESWEKTRKLYQDDINEAESWRGRFDKFEIRSNGKLYQVELAPSQDEYLLWDEPLSGQSEKVKAALFAAWDGLNINQSFEDAHNKYLRGENFYRSFQNGLLIKSYVLDAINGTNNSEKAASEYLHSFGIRGIKYLDGTSRGKGDGQYNYVIFDDNDISIEAKYSR